MIRSTLLRAERTGLDWPAVERLSDAELEARLYCGASPGGALARGLPDFAEVHAERQRRGVTLALLHVETNPAGYGKPNSVSTIVAGAGSGACRCVECGVRERSTS